jgi:FKBP-type peptidyl-prolyl cis-trans isomerase 2
MAAKLFKVFFICRDEDGKFVCGSEQTASRCVIGRGWFLPELENVLALMRQGERRRFTVPRGEVAGSGGSVVSGKVRGVRGRVDSVRQES